MKHILHSSLRIPIQLVTSNSQWLPASLSPSRTLFTHWISRRRNPFCSIPKWNIRPPILVLRESKCWIQNQRHIRLPIPFYRMFPLLVEYPVLANQSSHQFGFEPLGDGIGVSHLQLTPLDHSDVSSLPVTWNLLNSSPLVSTSTIWDIDQTCMGHELAWKSIHHIHEADSEQPIDNYQWEQETSFHTKTVWSRLYIGFRRIWNGKTSFPAEVVSLRGWITNDRIRWRRLTRESCETFLLLMQTMSNTQ